MKARIFLVLVLLISTDTIANAQFLKDVGSFVSGVAKTTVKTVTAPTEAVINTGKFITGQGSATDIYRPLQQAVQQIGSTTVQTTNILLAPQNYFMQEAEKYAQSVGGNTGAFIFDVGTFSNRYYNQLAQSGVQSINGVIQGQNPLQISAIPLSAAIRAARERHYNQSQPLPDDVKNGLRGHFSDHILNRARYCIGNIQITLPNFIGQGQKFFGNDAYAVVVDDIIVFNTNPGTFAQNAFWWTHEVKHVEQYSQWGIETFAFNYLKNSKSIEDEADFKATQTTGIRFSNHNALVSRSFDMSSSSIDQNVNFNHNPETYVAQCIFPNDYSGYSYLITNYGRIIAINSINGAWYHIGYSTPPYVQNSAWTYYLPSYNWGYSVGNDGKIYNPQPVRDYYGNIIYQQWSIVGYVVRL